MPVPSGAVPIKITDGWPFADADELGVKSVVDRDEELSSSPARRRRPLALGPATTNGVANATTNKDLTRCMMAATDIRTLMSNQGSSRRQSIDCKAPREVGGCKRVTEG